MHHAALSLLPSPALICDTAGGFIHSVEADEVDTLKKKEEDRVCVFASVLPPPAGTSHEGKRMRVVDGAPYPAVIYPNQTTLFLNNQRVCNGLEVGVLARRGILLASLSCDALSCHHCIMVQGMERARPVLVGLELLQGQNTLKLVCDGNPELLVGVMVVSKLATKEVEEVSISYTSAL